MSIWATVEAAETIVPVSSTVDMKTGSPEIEYVPAELLTTVGDEPIASLDCDAMTVDPNTMEIVNVAYCRGD